MRRSKTEAEQTKHSILMCALELFANKGYKATSLSSVADKSGLTRGAIYWHFKNKADIFAALGELYLKPYIEKMDNALHSDNSWQQSANILIETLIVMKKEPAQLQFVRICETQKFDGQNEKINDILTNYENICQIQVHQLIQCARQAGEIPENTDPIFAFLLIKCCIEGIINFYTDPIHDIDIQPYIRRIIQQTFNYIAQGGCL